MKQQFQSSLVVQLLAVAACLLAALVFNSNLVTALPVGVDTLPSWVSTSDPSSTGTMCLCLAQASEYHSLTELDCTTIRNNNSFVDPVIPDYTCECNGYSVHCGVNEIAVEQDFVNGTGLCDDLEANVTTPWEDTAPPCKDVFGNTCGGLAGVRTATRVVYDASYPLNLITEGYGVVQGQSCQKITIRAMCTTPVCPVQPVDCEEELEYGPWSNCVPFQDTCLKTRVKAIRVNASDGGVACRSLEARTETSTCTVAECQKVRCNYTAVTVAGNCTNACGLTTRNVTVYNVSATPLSICSQAVDPVISVTEYPCLNLPCTDLDEPINITCETRGYQGYLDSAVKYIVLSLGGLDITSNHTNTSFAAHTTITYNISGRAMPFDVNGVIYTGTEIWFPLKTSDADFAKNTGTPFKLQYIAPEQTNHSLMAGDQVVPSFICYPEDKVAPILLRVFRPPNEGSLFFTMEFSETVKWVNPSAPPGYLSVFRFNNFQNVEPEPFDQSCFTEKSRFISIYLIPVDPLQLGVYANASIQVITEDLMDLNGNPVVVNGSLIPIEDDIQEDGGIRQALPAGAYDTIKIYSNNSRGVPDSAYIMTNFPVEQQNVLANVGECTLSITVTIDGANTTVSAPGIAAYFEDTWVDDSADGFPVGFIMKFASDDPFLNQVFNSSFDLSTATISYSLFLAVDAIAPAFFQGFSSEGTGTGVTVDNVTSLEPPGLHKAVAYAGDVYICVNFTTPRTSSINLTSQDFFYRGPNRVIDVYNQSATEACLEMESEVDYSAFDADRLVFLDTTASGIRPPLIEHPIVSLSGIRPRIVSAKLYNAGGGKVWDKLTVLMDTAIVDPEADDASDLVSFTWDNPAIQSIVATAYTVSDRTVNFTIKTTCTDVCSDTGAGVRFDLGGLASEGGASVYQASSFQVADISRPRLESAIKFSTYSYVISPSEDLDTTKHLWTRGLQPPPEDCNFLGRTEWVCLMEEGFDSDEVITANGVFAVDRNDNYELIELTTTAKVLHESSSCSSFFDLPLLIVVPTSIFAFVGVAGVVSMLASKCWPNARGRK